MRRFLFFAWFLGMIFAAGCGGSNGGFWEGKIFGDKKQVPQDSPEQAMNAYKECLIQGQVDRLWLLYSENLKSEVPKGVSELKTRWNQNPVTDIQPGKAVSLSTGKVIFYNIVIFRDETITLRKVTMVEELGKWFIDDITVER